MLQNCLVVCVGGGEGDMLVLGWPQQEIVASGASRNSPSCYRTEGLALSRSAGASR